MRATIVGVAAALLVLVSACGSTAPSEGAATTPTTEGTSEEPASATTAPGDTPAPVPPPTDADADPGADDDRWVGGVPGGVDIELLDPARFSVDEWFVVDDDGRRAAGRRGADELCEVDLASDGSTPPRCVAVTPDIVDALQVRQFLALRWPSAAPLALTISGGRAGATGAEAFTLATYVMDFVAGTVIRVATGEQEIVLGVDTDRTVTLASARSLVRRIGGRARRGPSGSEVARRGSSTATTPRSVGRADEPARRPGPSRVAARGRSIESERVGPARSRRACSSGLVGAGERDAVDDHQRQRRAGHVDALPEPHGGEQARRPRSVNARAAPAWAARAGRAGARRAGAAGPRRRRHGPSW
jgi:hypothetical protein